MRTSLKTGLSAALFFILTFAISWSLMGYGISQDNLLWVMLGVWGPSLAAILLSLALTGASGLRRLLGRFTRFKAPICLWLALLILPASLHLIGRSAWQAFYDGQVTLYFRPLAMWPSAILPSLLIAGLGEELGWRGFALPRLQSIMTPLRAALVIGLVHTLWHLPTYWAGAGIHPVPAIWMPFFAIPFTIIAVWFFNRSGGSLVFAVGFHTIANASLSIVSFMPDERLVPITPDLLTRLTLPLDLAGPYLSVIALYLLVAIGIVVTGGLEPPRTDASALGRSTNRAIMRA